MNYFFTLSHRVESKRQSTQGQKSSPTPNPYSRKKKWQTDFWKMVGFLGDGLWTGTCECTLLLICSLVTVCMTKQRSSSWKTCPDALCQILISKVTGNYQTAQARKSYFKEAYFNIFSFFWYVFTNNHFALVFNQDIYKFFNLLQTSAVKEECSTCSSLRKISA